MTYDVLVTKHNGKFMARVRAWPEIVVEGDTEEEVLRKAQADLKVLLMTGRIIQFELDVKPAEHPWQTFAGMFADDPDWDAFQAAIQQYREDIDGSCAKECMFILDTDRQVSAAAGSRSDGGADTGGSWLQRFVQPGATPKTLDRPTPLTKLLPTLWYYAAAVEGACFKYSRISALTRAISAK